MAGATFTEWRPERRMPKGRQAVTKPHPILGKAKFRSYVHRIQYRLGGQNYATRRRLLVLSISLHIYAFAPST